MFEPGAVAGTAPGASIPVQDITGLVLAGGRGSRMGHVDKGLVLHGGVPLAVHALHRLAAQVGKAAVNANRNLPAYAAFGAPVWPDRSTAQAGPLAGMLAGLDHCSTPYLVTVPCDAPRFPADLVARLAGSLTDANADLAVAVTEVDGRLHRQPVFCLMKRSLQADLADFLSAGGHRVGAWIERVAHATAVFDSADAFANLNTPEELARAAVAP